MKRLEYMTILRQKLVDGGLGNDEINDALEFYEELFLDGGYENEEKTAQNLGDPEALAQQILAENGAVGFVRPEYKMEDAIDNRGQQPTPPPQTDYNIAPDNRNIAAIVLILVTSVIWGPLLIGLLAGAFGLTVGLAAGIFAIGCSGLGLIVAGGVTAFQAPPVGVLLIGVGLFLTGLGVLIFVPFCKLVIGLFKKFFGWLTRSLRTIFNNVKNNKAVSENG